MKHNCKEELRDVELKATPARLAILDVLEHTDAPLDVAAIIEALEKDAIKTDQATVFRIMNSFTQKRLVRQIQLHEGKFRYEMASMPDHHHLMCEECGKIEDISDCAISDLESDIRKKKGFVVKHHSLEFFGVCQQCQR